MPDLKFVDVTVRLQLAVPEDVTAEKLIEEVDYDFHTHIPGAEIQAMEIINVTPVPSWGAA